MRPKSKVIIYQLSNDMKYFLKMLLKMQTKRPYFNVLKVMCSVYPNLSRELKEKIKQLVIENNLNI